MVGLTPPKRINRYGARRDEGAERAATKVLGATLRGLDKTIIE
ncbi:hypothetical protein PF002_g19872 [Phytophthora fragariae]|nr:hypothetical protein PF003_g17600 [Phytophthora fragariae]KAE8936722.1 hypothetical protein PF009_g13351 [Phytophthora fragariae]KAE9001885.1 hypothetical protein PF011_g13552 [Phytophthora fragariae]KAE9092017.1 hypothetical protein PF007_g18674 [Phytophthora fragariae]KAE9206860.1 hypothetical protein PF002_g19872 [Phytophthora fragariae]